MKPAVVFSFWILCCLFQEASFYEAGASVDKRRSDKVKSTSLGKRATLKCVYNGYPTPQVLWTKEGKKVEEKCKFCVQKVNNTVPGISSLHVTPYRHSDFGEYKCKARNKLGFGTLTIGLRQEKSKNITQCERDRILSRDPRLKLEFRPRCNADGTYHVIQCSVHLDTCWCVDKSGHKVADALEGEGGMHCTQPVAVVWVIGLVAFGVGAVLILVLLDVICLVTCNKGIINRLLRQRKKHRKYRKVSGKEARNENKHLARKDRTAATQSKRSFTIEEP